MKINTYAARAIQCMLTKQDFDKLVRKTKLSRSTVYHAFTHNNTLSPKTVQKIRYDAYKMAEKAMKRNLDVLNQIKEKMISK